jgi:hypothetical protein
MKIHAGRAALWARHVKKGNETANNQKKEATYESEKLTF